MNDNDEIDLGRTRRIDEARSALAERHADGGGVSRYEARRANLDAVRRRDRRERAGWCILQTSPSSTIRLARSLRAADIEAWTPVRTFKREKPGRCRLIDGKKPTVEIDAPILPGFVFAVGQRIEDLIGIAAQEVSRHPSYSVFRYGDRYPLVGDADIAGLKEEEARAGEHLTALREAESREERKRILLAAAKNEQQRRKMLRAQRRHFTAGEEVAVADMPALAGMTGIVESGDGRSATIVFGGVLRMKVEAWQVVPRDVEASPIRAGK